MARKNGCPMNVRNWQIDIMSRASTREAPAWIRVKGIGSLTFATEGETEDGSAGDALWAEPYVSKRSGTLSIEGRPIADAVTGEQDPGQAELDYYAAQGGCAGDATLRLADPYGHAQLIDVVVTKAARGADDGEQTVSWETALVGEPEPVEYVQVTGVSVKDGQAATGAVSIAVGETKALSVAFEPEDASNRKYSAASADPARVRVKNVDGLGFEIYGAAATDGAVDVVVRSMNNRKSAVVAVTVTAA